MRKDIQSTYYHCSSTDDKPQHHLCPVGKDSWCFYRKAEAEGLQPKSHKEMKVYFRVSDDMNAAILSIYENLTSNSLLERCLKGQTQNANESFHSKFWAKCSKVKFAGLTKVLFGARVTIIQHNFGYGDELVLSELGLSQTVHGKQTQDLFEKRRLGYTPKVGKKRKLEKPSEEYKPGCF